MRRGNIIDTVGLWGTPNDKFRIFKGADEQWHVVWPYEAMARTITPHYEQARQTVVAEMKG